MLPTWNALYYSLIPVSWLCMTGLKSHFKQGHTTNQFQFIYSEARKLIFLDSPSIYRVTLYMYSNSWLANLKKEGYLGIHVYGSSLSLTTKKLTLWRSLNVQFRGCHRIYHATFRTKCDASNCIQNKIDSLWQPLNWTFIDHHNILNLISRENPHYSLCY